MAQSVPMKKLRDLYSQTQRNANQNFDKVTQQRMKKILTFANKQYENMLNNNDFTYLDEIVFYRDKFQEIVNVFNVSIEQGYKKPRVKAEITAILKANFSQQQVGEFNYAAHESATAVGQKIKGANELEAPQPQKQVIQSYFDSKKEEIQRSKIGFKSVIEGIPYIPKKYAVKEPFQKKVADLPPPPPQPPVPNRDGEVKALKDQIARLKKQFADQQGQKDFRLGILQQQRRQYQQRIKELTKELQHIQNQNIILKEQSAKNYPISTQPYYVPVIEEIEEPEYNPYQIKFRENDINKIKNKLSTRQPNKLMQLPVKSHSPFIKEQSQQYDKKSNNFQLINHLDLHQDGPKQKDSFSALNASNYRSNQSGIKNQLNHIALKSKISFFKNSMILYKGDQFQIAVRSADIVRLHSKKISLFINNKSKGAQAINFQYKFDPSYYQVAVTRKLKGMERNSQGKEEVEVKLINQFDLDSLIEVQLAINDRNIVFLLPALFIEFQQGRPERQRDLKYQTQKIIPIHQFANLLSAEEFIPLEKLYGQYQQAGRVYAVSRAHEGYIYFKWSGGSVQIKTIGAWKLLFGYLLLREY